MTLKPITVSLDRVTTGKINLIQESISEPTTYAKVIEGLIDVGFANAINTLHEQGRLTKTEYKDYLDLLPEHLLSCLGNKKSVGPSHQHKNLD